MRRPYLVRIGDWLSAGINTVLLGGTPDESTSGRAYRESLTSRRWAVLRRLIDALFWWEPDHCERAYWADLARCRERVGEATLPSSDG